ncbi:hypothetical protein [Streptomyces sp. NPDC016845]|uniref:hypothetical protein n=1 Tax=Streptomyces sp. NPDC016845 TaxID=3364972 RepID=UPI0037B4BF0B
MPLYPLHGTIIVTGRDSDGGLCGLDETLARQAQAVVTMVADTVRQWQHRPPASNEAATRELLAYATREVATA